jgi:glycosyltransferase involved in cell wall biosynthesis
MNDSKPLISIGLPVYNGEDYVRQALDSLLAQSYTNLEINISDNASTDHTEEICRLYSAKDKRIRYYRNSQNLGILPNWRRVLELASGDYFMWAAHDDHWSENYLQTLLQCLLDNPKAILAAGKTVYVDGTGEIRNNVDLTPDFAPRRCRDGNVGVARQLLLQHAHNWLHGLYPKAVLGLSSTFFAEDAWGSDVLFLLELCLSRQVVGTDEAIIYKRARMAGTMHPRAPNTPKERVKWQCWFARALMRVISRSPLSPKEKIEVTRIYVAYLKWLYLRKGLYSFAELWLRAGYHSLREYRLAYKRVS